MNLKTDYLTPSKWTRPGKLRDRTHAIIIHWVANPRQFAESVRNYWETRSGSYGSAHAVVDNDGTVIQTLPWDEVGYHVGSKTYTRLARDIFEKRAFAKSSPNHYTVGVELCHQNWEGELTDTCWNAAAELVANLCRRYNLNPFKALFTHQMIVGWKECPKWMVQHPDEFELFKRSVADHM